jgi:hypothetical protein
VAKERAHALFDVRVQDVLEPAGARVQAIAAHLEHIVEEPLGKAVSAHDPLRLGHAPIRQLERLHAPFHEPQPLELAELRRPGTKARGLVSSHGVPVLQGGLVPRAPEMLKRLLLPVIQIHEPTSSPPGVS